MEQDPQPKPAVEVSIGDPVLPGITEVDEDLARELSEALAAKGADYEPRTEHKDDSGPEYTNRLIRETSPYLLQHAHNPVNWFPWGDEALARAKAQDRPVLLSIGYSTCHWCHVMERESFEDVEVATFINEHFIPIKVDREERPDLDGVYMSAVQMLTGRGGWPMTVVLTPDKEPFFGGTYFPARDGDRGARKGFLTILDELSRSYAEDREGTIEQAKSISERMATAATPPPGRGQPRGRDLIAAKDQVLRRFDERRGGFGNAPKFPRPVNLEFLLRVGRRSADPQAIEAVAFTMDAMLAGGIYDQVGGGFHRYSVDADWLVPHFEKMLYDNGQLLEVLADLYVLVEDPKRKANYKRAMRDTAAYLARDMKSPGGAYYAATDADSPKPGTEESEEGLYFTWTPAELEEALTSDSSELAYATARWGVTRAGNFEGRTILSRVKTPEEAIELAGIDADPEGMEREVIRRVLVGRDRMPPPHRDEKILAGWNALAISGLSRAAFVLDDPQILNQARAAATFLLDKMWTGSGDDARLTRSYASTRVGAPGFLDDYAFTVQALLDLYEADGDTTWLEAAKEIQAVQDQLFIDDAGAYAMTPSDGEELLVRESPFYDGAVPSGNSVAAMNLLRLAEYLDDEAYKTKAQAVFKSGSTMIARASASVPNLLSAADFALDQPRQIFIVAPADLDEAKPLLEVVRTSYVPNRIVTVAKADDVTTRAQLIPAIEGKLALKGKPTAFVCEAKTCKKPTSDPTELRNQLGELKRLE